MRTLSAGLLAAQKSATVTPYVKVVITEPVSPYTTYTFDTHAIDGAEKRILPIEHYEEPYGGAATIRLANYDQYFGAKNLKGWQVTLGFGAKCWAWVSPTGHTDPDNAWSDEASAYDDDLNTYASTFSVVYYLELSRAATSCSKVRLNALTADNVQGYINPDVDVDVYYNSAWHNIHSGTITKQTWAEIDIGSTQTVTGVRVKFNQSGDFLVGYLYEVALIIPASEGLVTYEVSNVAPLFVWSQRDVSYGGVLATELLCLDLWWQIAANMVILAGEKIHGTITNANDFKIDEVITSTPAGATGVLIGVSYDSILVTSVNGTFAGKTSAAGATGSIVISSVDTVTYASGYASSKTVTIKDIITALLPSSVDGVVLDSDDPDNTVNTYKPLLETAVGSMARTIIRQLFQMTKCGGRIENDSKLHILYLDVDAEADYTYQTDHVFWYQMRERAVIMPNAVLFVDILPDNLGNVPTYSGTSKHQASVDLIGEFSTIETNPSIEANGDVAGGAERFAKAWIHQRVAEAYQGAVRAPMHCGQELYDMVSIVDSRSGVTVTGRVGRIDRRYRPGLYEIELRLGGIISEYNAIPGWDSLDSDIKDLTSSTDTIKIEPFPPISGWIPAGQQAYIADIDFTSVDYNHISWTAGNVKFADGRIQAVTTTGSPLLLTATHYLYIIWNNSTLQSSTTYSDAIGTDRVLVGVAAIGSSSAVSAYVLNPHTDSILINRDKVMDGLVNDLKLASEAVTEAKIAASAVTSGKIAAGAVIAGKIAALSIAAGDIAADAVTADKILAGSVTAIKIDVATLDAISANVGTLTAGTITGVDISHAGGSVKISISGLDLDKITGYTGALRLNIGGDLKAYLWMLNATTCWLEVNGNTFVIAGSLIRPASTWDGGFHGDLGSSDIKWRNIYVKYSNVGDVIFENKWRLKETDKGIALVRPDGSVAKEWR